MTGPFVLLELKCGLSDFMIYYSSAKWYFRWLHLEHDAWWSMRVQASHWLQWQKPKECSNSLSTMSTITFSLNLYKWSWILSSLEGRAVFIFCLAVLPCCRRSSNCKLERPVALGSLLHVQTVIRCYQWIVSCCITSHSSNIDIWLHLVDMIIWYIAWPSCKTVAIITFATLKWSISAHAQWFVHIRSFKQSLNQNHDRKWLAWCAVTWQPGWKRCTLSITMSSASSLKIWA